VVLSPVLNQWLYEIGIYRFSAKHAALRSKRKTEWLARNQNYVSEWGDMSTCWLLFQWAGNIKFQQSVLSKADSTIISSNTTCSRNTIAKALSLGIKQQSLTHAHTNR